MPAPRHVPDASIVGVRGMQEPPHPLLADIEQADDLVHPDLLEQRPELSRHSGSSSSAIRIMLSDAGRSARMGGCGTGALPSTATPVIHLTRSSTPTSWGRRLATI